ncbi:chromosomal replication initiator protein DnaA [Holzapfeliella sp. He02]|uniref:Chromosomal replication initiator protein DnaA n=1 Tax=Holzapfeliella saturejae TaxID=3082953 RepID=A0ABU8SEM1_9LACO
MFNLNSFWEYFTNEMKKRYNEVTYNAWFRNTHPISFDENTKQMTISVETAVSKGYWEKNLSSDLIQEAYGYADLEISPIFYVESQQQPEAQSTTYASKQQPIQTSKERPETSSNDTQHAKLASDLRLNNKYTFDTFVQGEGNKLAAGAAMAIADNPGDFYNPLFIFGGVGLGKTHLMQAIAHQMLREDPNCRVVYIQSETFVNDLINSIKNNTQEAFRRKYRNADLFLVDDIQFFANKQGIQEEFFHTFETLYSNQKQIVMTSDRLPNEIKSLSERLSNRFAWGLQVEITPPDFETRIAILKKKADAEKIKINDATISYIAKQVDTNIRNLEGALVRVQAHATIKRQDINPQLAQEALQNLNLVQQFSSVTIAKIQEVVANYYQVSTSDLKGKKRVKTIVLPRQIAMYLSRNMTDKSLPKIGQEFGGKDHTTVMHAHERITELVKIDSDIKNQINDITQKLTHN